MKNELSGWFIIYNDLLGRDDDQKILKLFLICDFNMEHFIFPYNETISNISEEEQYITCMQPTEFINSQDESICNVNLSFQVHYFNMYFILIILNIYCDKIIDQIYYSEE